MSSDYLSSVYHFLDYEMNEKPQEQEIAVVVQQPMDGNFNIGYEEV